MFQHYFSIIVFLKLLIEKWAWEEMKKKLLEIILFLELENGKDGREKRDKRD